MSKKDLMACLPYEYNRGDVFAIKAVAQGSASPEQQRRALDIIINGIAHTYDVSYRMDSDRETVFAEGSRWVGLQLVKLVNLDPKLIPSEGN